MDAMEWIDRCAARVSELWPDTGAASASDVALELWRERRWRLMEPEAAAENWVAYARPPETLL